jgi:branched-chain amino acid transport system substrate-binding protein
MRALLAAAMVVLSVAAAATQTAAPPALPPVKIVIAAEAGGPDAAAGRQVIDGLMLALAPGGTRPGGREIVTIPFDLNRPLAEVQAQLPALIKQEQAQFVVGRLAMPGFAAQLKSLSESGVITLIPGWGSAELAGKRCLANVFSTGAQEDQGIDTLAKFADEAGYRRIVLVTSPQGEGAAKVFKRQFKGELLREVMLKDGAADDTQEVAGLVSDKPGAVLLLTPAATAERFLPQMRGGAGLEDVPVLTQAAAEESALTALGPAAKGVLSAGVWAQGLEGPDHAAFISAFGAAYGSLPSALAMQAHDAGQLILSAVGQSGGKGGAGAFGERIKLADIKSPRGAFTFANNNFPVQDFYVKRVESRADGGFISQPVKKVFVQFGDDYAAECPLK